ncbi:MAG: amidohydrolase [Planctomycetes bacterium]|nr:amidohydrolase [Planctomycetota bacterium]
MRTSLCRGYGLLLILTGWRAMAEEPADLIVVGGRIATMDSEKPEASAVAIRAGRIVRVGTDDEVLHAAGPATRRIDLKGRRAVPGFIEGHGHFLSFGESRMMLDLSTARTWREIEGAVERAARGAAPGQWIVGRGWHQGKWIEAPAEHTDGYPVHTRLSGLTPKNPVLLTHGTGHMVFANARAMELAGVSTDSVNPAGGEILRTADGEPTGVFRENAMGPIHRAHERALRGRSDAERETDTIRAMELAQEACFEQGVTSFQDAGSSFAEIDAMRRMIDGDRLRIRLWVMLNEGNDALAARLGGCRCVGYGGERLTVRAIKRMSDGALGTHGAWLLEPYDDMPSSVGNIVTPIETIERTAAIAIEHECQLCVHAIGDRANREVLDLFERAASRSGSGPPPRWRVEHAQHVHPDDIPRFAKLGVIASMQAVHATSDGPFVVRRLGMRRAREGAYAWRALLDAGAVIVNGTDVPVERVDPLASFAASVTRRMANGEAFFPEQAMTRGQALRSYTLDAAYAAFEESIKGSIAPGKLADLVILSQDILTIPDDALPAVRVDCTIVGGRVVFERAESGPARDGRADP